MFGYVRISKSELKVKEYDLFKAYYCGLCKTLKQKYGFASRFGLSYDLTFLAVLLSSLDNDAENVAPSCCIANPLKKKPLVSSNDYLEYSATANVLLTYFKLYDDFLDNHSIRSVLCLPLIFPAYRKAKKESGILFDKIKESMEKLHKLEKQNSSDVDALSNEFAHITQAIFSTELIKCEKTRRILSQMGYLIGRFIYLLDVLDDYDRDVKKGNFNPIKENASDEAKDELAASLEFTLSEIANAYNLLDIKKNKPILDNIIYLGLMDSLQNVVHKKGR